VDVRKFLGRLNNRYAWFLVSTAIVGLTIYFADVSNFVETLSKADPVFLVPAFIFGLAVFPVWGYVWQRTFRTLDIEIGFTSSLRTFMAGFFMNSVTPLGQFGGEPVMAYIIKDAEDIDYTKAITSVFTADVVNTVPVLTFGIGGALYLFAFGSSSQVLAQVIYVVVAVVLLGVPLMYLIWFESGKLERFFIEILEYLNMVGLRGSWTETAKEKVSDTMRSFEMIGENPRDLFEITLVAHVGFLFQVFCLYFILFSLGYRAEMAPLYLIQAFSGLANFSPTPGGSGTFEAAMAGLVSFFLPVSFAVGISAAILFRLTTFWPGLGIGYLALNHINGEKR